MNADILRGFTEAIILNILKESDSYGYKISRKIIEKTDNLLNIKDATIYLAFKRMEQNDLIRHYWSDNEEGARRKYYKITDKGCVYLKDKCSEWERNKKILDNLLGDAYEGKI